MVFVQIASQLVSLVVLAILFRHVDRAAFGLMGMAVPLLMFPRMVLAGLGAATIQQEEISDQQRSMLFWINVLFGSAATGVSALFGPLFAWLYGAPQLVSLCLVLSGTSFILALGAQHQALLERRLLLWRLSIVRIISQIAGGVAATIAAFNDWGIWSLVVQQYVELMVSTALVVQQSRWQPHLPRRVSLQGLLQFGSYYSMSMVFFFFVLNVDKIALSLLLGSTEAGRVVIGYYNQAFQLMMRPVYLVTTPIVGIMLPALSRARLDRQLYRHLTVAFYRMTAIVLIPSGMGLTLVAPDVMRFLGGANWADAGLLLLVLAPIVAVKGAMDISGSLMGSVGRADRLCFGALVQAVVLTQAVIVAVGLARRFDFAGLDTARLVAAGYGLTTLLVLAVPYLAFCFRTAEIPPASVARTFIRPALASCGMGVVVWLVGEALQGMGQIGSSAGVRLAGMITSGIVSYTVFARSDVRWLLRQLTSRDGL